MQPKLASYCHIVHIKASITHSSVVALELVWKIFPQSKSTIQKCHKNHVINSCQYMQHNYMFLKGGVQESGTGANVTNKKLTVHINWKVYSGLVRLLCILDWKMKTIRAFLLFCLLVSKYSLTSYNTNLLNCWCLTNVPLYIILLLHMEH